MQAPLSIQPLAQAIEQFKVELQSVVYHGSSPIVRIGAWLREQSKALASQPSLHNSLTELCRNVANWEGLDPELGQVLARIQLLLQKRFSDLTSEEATINWVEAQVTPDHFNFIRAEGRVVDPTGQLNRLEETLLRYEGKYRKAFATRGSVSIAQSYVERAQWVADRIFLESLNALSIRFQDLEWEQNPTQTAKWMRNRLATGLFSNIKAAMFHDFFPPELTTLNIVDLNLSRRICLSVGRMSSLKALTLSRLQQFPLQILHLAQLEQLQLEGSHLVAIPDGISRLTNLARLLFPKNSLKSLPEKLTCLTKLESLTLSENQLTSMPVNVVNLTSLKRLIINSNQITECPDSISKLVHLEELNFSGNQIRSFPKQLSQLTNLSLFSVDGNPLNEFPPLNSTSLRTLNFKQMYIRAIPSSIGALTGLCVLELEGNPLEEIAPEIARCTVLQSLRCDKEAVPFLPETLTQCQSLRDVGPLGRGWVKICNGTNFGDFLKASHQLIKIQ